MKNTSNRYKFFKLNYKYYSYVLFEEDTNLFSRSKSVDKLANK